MKVTLKDGSSMEFENGISVLEVAKTIRVGFLQQNAFHKDDSYVTLKKQKCMMNVILHFYNKAIKCIGNNIDYKKIK